MRKIVLVVALFLGNQAVGMLSDATLDSSSAQRSNDENAYAATFVTKWQSQLLLLPPLSVTKNAAFALNYLDFPDDFEKRLNNLNTHDVPKAKILELSYTLSGIITHAQTLDPNLMVALSQYRAGYLPAQHTKCLDELLNESCKELLAKEHQRTHARCIIL